MPEAVLLTAYSLGIGGSERQVSEMAKALRAHGFSPHVACFRDSGFRAGELRSAGVPILHLPVSSFGSTSALRAAMTLRRYIRENDVRLVHSFDYPTTTFMIPLARAFGVPAVLSSMRCHRDLIPGWHRRFVHVTDRLVNGIVTNCEFVRRHLIADEGVPESKIQVCYNGLDAAIFANAERRKIEAVRDERLVIGTVAVLRPEKGLDLLIAAFAACGLPEAKLAIVGSGQELGALQAQADRLRIADRLMFQPAVENVAEWLSSFDIFVLPSRSEALSNSLMEAMASGCAVVASDTGGNPELVVPNQTGLLFPSGNAAALSENLRTLAADPVLRARLGAAAAARIAQEFSIDKAACGLARIYRAHLGTGFERLC